MLTISVEAICLNYRPKKDNTFPIMLRLTKSGKRKYVSLGISVKEKDWDFKKNQAKKACPDREAIVKLISDKVSAYNSLIMELTAKQQEGGEFVQVDRNGDIINMLKITRKFCKKFRVTKLRVYRGVENLFENENKCSGCPASPLTGTDRTPGT